MSMKCQKSEYNVLVCSAVRRLRRMGRCHKHRRVTRGTPDVIEDSFAIPDRWCSTRGIGRSLRPEQGKRIKCGELLNVAECIQAFFFGVRDQRHLRGAMYHLERYGTDTLFVSLRSVGKHLVAYAHFRHCRLLLQKKASNDFVLSFSPAEARQIVPSVLPFSIFQARQLWREHHFA